MKRLSELTLEELRALYDRNNGLRGEAFDRMVEYSNMYAEEIVGMEKAFRDYCYGSYCPGHFFDILDGPGSEFLEWYKRVSYTHGFDAKTDAVIRAYIDAADRLLSDGNTMSDTDYDKAEAVVDKLRLEAGDAIDGMINGLYDFSDDDAFYLLSEDIENYGDYYLDDSGNLWREMHDVLIR